MGNEHSQPSPHSACLDTQRGFRNAQRTATFMCRDGTAFRYAELATLTGLPGDTLNLDPAPTSPVFPCPDCSRVCFDGGLCKLTKCACGLLLLRSEDNSVQYFSRSMRTEVTEDDAFSALFKFCNNPDYGERSELQYLDIGVFAASHEPQRRVRGLLREFFRRRGRVMGAGDYFGYEGVYFKVIRSYPLQGVVTRRTRLMCGRGLQRRKLERVHFQAISPHELTPDILSLIVHPHFSVCTQHLQIRDRLSLHGFQCVAVAATPPDGVIDPTTQITYGSASIPKAEKLVLAPYRDDLPPELLALSRDSMAAAFMEFYVRPFFMGQFREVRHGESIEIQHATFRVMEMRPASGVVTEETEILCDGATLSREHNSVRLIVPLLSVSALAETGHPEVSSMELALFRTRETRRILTHMLALINQMEAAQEPVDTTVIEQLPTRALTSIPASSDLRQCMICLSDFAVSEEVRTLPCCNLHAVHFFHVECIDKWAQRSRLCPVCKHSVTEVDALVEK